MPLKRRESSTALRCCAADLPDGWIRMLLVVDGFSRGIARCCEEKLSDSFSHGRGGHKACHQVQPGRRSGH
ncbi:hypothetical protein AALO_G00217900 [Alosa alosa]|uniref:Uncharacterized protein n=1 Tax=Alosa alosa TaxID=278164 RepID=A0AAV6G1I2_9TELE|nr:hypothetical protein AALO_G00217900 [Alosa alosa]